MFNIITFAFGITAVIADQIARSKSTETIAGNPSAEKIKMFSRSCVQYSILVLIKFKIK